MQPKLTVSGYRGIWGESLTPEIAKQFASAFCQFILKRGGKNILIARDARGSGKEITDAIIPVFLSAGIDVIETGITPTPTVLFLVREQKLGGAIIVTASHNPIEYNGLKFVTDRGLFTNEADVAEMMSSMDTPVSQSSASGSHSVESELWKLHVEKIVSHVDRELIASKKLRVVVDVINSVGAVVDPYLFELLGVEAVILNGTPDGNFAHKPEPLPENLGTLGEKVRELKADIGFAQDPDGDRLVVVDETGTVLFEELTLALGLRAVLEKTPGDIVINLSTSSVNEMIAEQFGGKTFRSKVGESNVIEAMMAQHAVAGGEGSGGFIYPKMNAARDSVAGIAVILELLAKEEKPLSEIVATLPKTVMKKTKLSIQGVSLEELYRNVRTLFPNGVENILDGLRLDFPDRSWIHIRPSNTEPLVRVYFEAMDERRADELLEKIEGIVK